MPPHSASEQSEIKAVLAQARPRYGMRLLLAVVVLAGAGAWFVSHQGEKTPLYNYVSAPVEKGNLTVEVTATGTLEPLNKVEVGSEISGKIETVLVDYNARVSKGQELARLNTDEQQARVVQAQAALEVAQARVEVAAATLLETDLKWQRCQILAKQGLCPAQDQDVAKATYARAKAEHTSTKAQVSQARATLEAEQTRLAKATIRSPIEGIVLKRQVEPGQTVAASLQAPVLFTLAENLAQMELRVAVDEADIGKVKAGQLANFTVDAYGDRVFPATITQVRLAPLTEGGVVSYETMLQVNNDEALLRPGMTATSHIIVQQIADALLVPNAALRFTPPVVEKEDRGNILEQLFPRWGSRERAPRSDNKAKKVWLLQGSAPVAVEVKTGPSDGRVTQVFAENLAVGAAVVTDAVKATR